MGVPHEKREAADRKRTAKARKVGTTKGPYRSYAITVPSWLARDIAESDDPDVIEEAMRSYEYRAELTAEGILFRAVRMVAIEGWQKP